MKKLISPVALVAFLQFSVSSPSPKTILPEAKPASHLFIITLDGVRWQEIFWGADSFLLFNEKYTPDTHTMKELYWASTATERRKRLLPFFWSVLQARGRLYGNRSSGSKVNVANDYILSYPGYNEIFTGTTDPAISTNAPHDNPNRNVLEYLDEKPGFKNKIAVFTSWNLFPSILNVKRNQLPVNSGYAPVNSNELSELQQAINTVQAEMLQDKTATRQDQLTFIAAKEYLRKHRPRVLYLGLGETDEAAHEGRYDMYLEKASQADQMIASLWNWVQTTPGYKDNTTFLITTDHGRGSRKWTSHGHLIRGSSQTWLALMGPGIKPLGEVQEEDQLYQRELASLIARLVGEEFTAVVNPYR